MKKRPKRGGFSVPARKAPALVIGKPVPVTTALQSALPRLSNDGQARTYGALAFYIDEFEKIKGNDPSRIAHTLQLEVDDHIGRLLREDPKAPRVKCRKGCSACCHLHVAIIQHEARLALDLALARGLVIDRPRLERQSAAKGAAWDLLPKADRACVFLGAQGECQIYEHRPASCRKHMVMSDPALCDVDTNAGANVHHLVSIEAEVVTSAAFNAYAPSTYLAEGLLRELDADAKGAQ